MTPVRSAFRDSAGRPMPRPRPALARGGALGTVVRDGLVDSYLGWARETGFRDYVVQLGAHPHVVAVEPDSVKRVLHDQAAFQRWTRPTEVLFGGGLFRLHGEPWRRRRRMFTPPFKRDSLASALPVVVREVGAMLDGWAARAGAPFRPAGELSDCMARILTRYLFDHAPSGLPSLHEALVTLSTDSVLRHVFSRPVAVLTNGRAVRRAHRLLDAACTDILERGGRTPFLQTLRAGVDAGDLDRRAALDEIRGFLVAGHETTATALAWTLALLAERPGLQADLRDEAAGVHLGTAGSAHTEQLVLGTAVVREAMRLYPPVPLSIHVAREDVRLGPWKVPEGTRIDLPSYVVHRCPDRWPDPERFDPHRFDGGAPGAESYLPFLAGPHLCLGRGLAMMELRAATAMICERFELSAPEGPPRPDLRLSLHPGGLVLAARER